MKKITVLIVLCVIGFTSFSQSNTTPSTNNTIIRLIILNDQDELLMRETPYGWMTPSMYYQTRQSLREIIDSLATSYGIEISNPNLGGVFTYKYKFKTSSDIRQFYVARYVQGELTSPVNTEKLYWIERDEAIKLLATTVTSLADMTRQVIYYPQTLWGGSFILDRQDGQLSSEIEENFYPLSGN